MIQVNLTFDQFLPVDKNGKSLPAKQREKRRFYESKIAGVTYRNTFDNLGPFVGYMEREPNNPYDSNAVAIYEHNGRHIGYLPKSEHRKYFRWLENMNRVVVVGYIYYFYIRSEARVGIGGYIEAMKMYTDEELDMFSEIIKKKYDENKSQYEFTVKDTERYYKYCKEEDNEPEQTQNEQSVQEEIVSEDIQEYEEDTNLNTLKWVAIAAISISAIFAIFI